MRVLLFSACMLLPLPLPALSSDLLGDVKIDLGRIAEDVRVKDPAISRDVYNLSAKIERVELSQSIQRDALSQRIYALERQVDTLKEIISKYEKLVAELESKIPKVAQ